MIRTPTIFGTSCRTNSKESSPQLSSTLYHECCAACVTIAEMVIGAIINN